MRWATRSFENLPVLDQAEPGRVDAGSRLPVQPQACHSCLLVLFILVQAGSYLTSTIAAPAEPELLTAPVGRTNLDVDRDWRFAKGDFPTAPMPGFDDSAWRLLTLPHDWSSEGPFGTEFASGTGYAPGGVGWYRKHFRLGQTARDKLVALEFDGIYNHSEVWVNGHFVGGRPYGYSSFECDLTPHLNLGTDDNVVAVRVDHSRFADSRWYTGSGIYRHVRLRLTEKLRIAPRGVWVTSEALNATPATVRVEVTIATQSGFSERCTLASEILDPDGQAVGSAANADLSLESTTRLVRQQLNVSHPLLWSVDTPRLYTLRNRLLVGSNVTETSTRFGIRSLRFDPDKGFFLNGVPLRLKGVCIHHDAGSLGAAVPEKVLERRLRSLKELGANAIRTSHNPPVPELLDLCDRLGLLVKDEAFDEFTPAKNKWVQGRNAGLPSRFGYAEDFADWCIRDIQDLVGRDRNHPCVILWSIGNEIDYANDPFSHPVLGRAYQPRNPPAENLLKLARPLIDAVHKLDPTRPVTAALATVAMSDAVGLGEALDAVGYNYQESRYPEDHAKYPKRFIFGSENSHAYSAWAAVRDHDYVAGQFLWTGIDYLGEAGRWPSRGSSAGLLDLCGFKKPLAWFRQSLWSDQPMVYLCASSGAAEGGGRFGGLRSVEHWNWPSNSTVTVRCYTTCPEVALTLNGRSLGTKLLTDAIDGALTWRVPFEPGVLAAEGRRAGVAISRFTLQTASSADRIELVPDRTGLAADGKDICHCEFRIVDAHGVRVPDAANDVTFHVEGAGDLLALENADMISPIPTGLTHLPAFHGRGLAFLRTTPIPGKITVTATASGLATASLPLVSR
jgi:beta-galactosidase